MWIHHMVALHHFLYKKMGYKKSMQFHLMIGLRHMMESHHMMKFHHNFGCALTWNGLTASEGPDMRAWSCFTFVEYLLKHHSYIKNINIIELKLCARHFWQSGDDSKWFLNFFDKFLMAPETLWMAKVVKNVVENIWPQKSLSRQIFSKKISYLTML